MSVIHTAVLLSKEMNPRPASFTYKWPGGPRPLVTLSHKRNVVASHVPLGVPGAWWWTGCTAVSHQTAAESSTGNPTITGMRDSWWQELGPILRGSRGLTRGEPRSTHTEDRRATAPLKSHGGHSVRVYILFLATYE